MKKRNRNRGKTQAKKGQIEDWVQYIKRPYFTLSTREILEQASKLSPQSFKLYLVMLALSDPEGHFVLDNDDEPVGA